MLSAIVLTKNSQETLASCLESLRFCDEIIVVDDASYDETVQIAKKYKAVVINHTLQNDFSKQRNFALKEAIGDWVLFVDADESVDSELKNAIQQAMVVDRCRHFNLKRKNVFLGKEIFWGEVYQQKIHRFGRKEGKWVGRVHEKWLVEAKCQKLSGFLRHQLPSRLKEMIAKIDYYSTLNAEMKWKNRINSNLLKIILFPIGKFIWNYFFKLGFLDGGRGLVLCMIMSLHSFLSWSKLLLIQKPVKL